MRCFAFLASISMACLPAEACLWEYATKLDGKVVETSGGPNPPLAVAYPPGHWEGKLREMTALCQAGASVEPCNDQAVALIHLGRSREAIPLLEDIEKKNSGLYQTAVNLGTALELAGENESALKWIQEGLRRNPQAHNRTEWLHARILEAKIAMGKDPQWLSRYSPLDGREHGPTGAAANPAWRTDGVAYEGRRLEGKEVIRAISYQLNERLQFVKPPEPIVGELLLELASMTALEENVEKALPLLKQAMEFKPARAQLLADRMKLLEGVVRNNPKSGKSTSDDSSTFSFALAGLLLAAMTGWSLYRWLRRRRVS